MSNYLNKISLVTKAKMVIAVSVVFTIALWYSQLYWFDGWYFTDEITKDIIIYKYLGKATAFATTILICWSFILNHKLPWIRQIFVDKIDVIRLNIFTTQWAFILMFIDPIFLAVNRLPNLDLFFGFYLPRSNSSFYGIGHNLGIAILLIILISTIILRLKFVHNIYKIVFRSLFALVPFLLIAHIIFVEADVSRYLLLKLWIFGWLIVAILSHIYSLLIKNN